MVQVYSILVYNCNSSDPVQMSEVYNLSDCKFFIRTTIKEYLRFASRNLAARTETNRYQNIRYKPEGLDQTFNAFCTTSTDKIAVIVITKDNYDLRVAHVLIRKVLEQVDASNNSVENRTLQALLEQYQNPAHVDNIKRIEADLDDTKEILIGGVNDLLLRGEKLEDLVKQSEDLSFASKAFRKKSRELNRCCNII